MTLSLYDEFAGWGGSSRGMSAVPGVELVLAANHNPLAVEVHALNFPGADHYLGDVAKADITGFPRADLFWASPVCPPWSNARGKRRDFDRSTQTLLFQGMPGTGPDVKTQRGRALMEEVPRYLRAMAERGAPVLAGVVENVVECRKWDEWDRWLREIRAAGPYKTRVIAFNSMHARPNRTLRAPQSRDRLYVAYWLDSLGRDPDWDKWLRPAAYCPVCDAVVDAMQVFKQPGVDMGRHGRHGQYYYRCPHTTCRHRIVEPEVLPAAAAIDWTLDPGQKIGERVDAKGRPDPLEPATLARIRAGLTKHGRRAMLTPAGGTWRDTPTPIDAPMPTRTTRETDGLFLPPLLVPTTGRTNKQARTVHRPLPTQTCRRETAVVIPPFMATLRGGGCKTTTRGVDQPLATFSADGTHHGLVIPPGGQLLMPYYRTGTPRPVSEPVGTLTTRDRYALIGTPTHDPPADVDLPAVEDCTFRMLATREIQRGMAFDPDYKVKGCKRDQVAGFGNAVTPPVGEILGSALVEAITGEAIDPAPHTRQEAT